MFWDIHGFLCSKHGPTTWLNTLLIWHCIKHVPLQCNSSFGAKLPLSPAVDGLGYAPRRAPPRVGCGVA